MSVGLAVAVLDAALEAAALGWNGAAAAQPTAMAMKRPMMAKTTVAAGPSEVFVTTRWHMVGPFLLRDCSRLGGRPSRAVAVGRSGGGEAATVASRSVLDSVTGNEPGLRGVAGRGDDGHAAARLA